MEPAARRAAQPSTAVSIALRDSHDDFCLIYVASALLHVLLVLCHVAPPMLGAH